MPNRSVAALALHPTEAQVFEAAAHFYAALLGAGRINETNQQGIMRYCLRSAMQLALEAEKLMQGDEPGIEAQGDEPPELDILEVDDVVAAPPRAPAPPPQRPRPPGGPAGAR